MREINPVILIILNSPPGKLGSLHESVTAKGLSGRTAEFRLFGGWKASCSPDPYEPTTTKSYLHSISTLIRGLTSAYIFLLSASRFSYWKKKSRHNLTYYTTHDILK